MTQTKDFPPVYQRLRAIMEPYAAKLVVKADDEDTLYLDTAHIMKNKQPVFFGSVQIKKNYVSYYLMPVYVFPELLEGMSPELQKRMQGKSCFNFTTVDERLFEELARLTETGFNRFVTEGYIK